MYNFPMTTTVDASYPIGRFTGPAAIYPTMRTEAIEEISTCATR